MSSVEVRCGSRGELVTDLRQQEDTGVLSQADEASQSIRIGSTPKVTEDAGGVERKLGKIPHRIHRDVLDGH